MQTYLKTRPVIVQFILFLAIAFGSFLVATSAGIFILGRITGIPVSQLQNMASWNMNNPATVTYMRGMILIQFLFLFTIPSLLFARFSDPQPGQYLGLRWPPKSIYWLLGIVLILASYPFVEYIGYVNQKLPFSPSTQKWIKDLEEQATRQISAMLRDRSALNLVKNLVFISLFAGIGEELFFRGVLQRMLIRLTKNAWMGIILSGAVFSFFHFQFDGFLPRMFLGVLLGAIYWYSGSLWVAMLCHFLYDAAVILLIYFNPQMLANPDATLIKGQEIGLLIGAMVSLAITFFILRQMEKQSVASYEAVYNDDFPKQKQNDNFSF